jgi:hypothetical protein
MKRSWIMVFTVLAAGLMLALGQTTQTAQEQAAQAHWADPRLDEVEELAMVRVAHLSPNAGTVEIALHWEDGEWTTQQTQQQEAGQGSLEVRVEPEDAVIAVAGPEQYAGQFSGSGTVTGLPVGTYVVTVTRLGYETVDEEVEVREGETATLEISLPEAEGDEAERLRQEEQPELEEPTLGVAPPEETEEVAVEEVEEVRERPDLTMMSYGDISGYVLVPAGEHRVTVSPAAQGEGQQQAFQAFETTVTLSAGGYYTLAAIGPVGAEAERAAEEEDEGFFDWLTGLFGDDAEAFGLRVEAFEDAPGDLPAAGHALVRVIHPSPGTGDVELRARRGTTAATAEQQQTDEHAFGAVSYGQAGGYEEIRADRRGYNLELHVAEQEQAAPEQPQATFAPGAIYTVFVTGTQFADYPMETIATLDARVVGERVNDVENDIENDLEQETAAEPEDEETDD